MRIIDSTLTSSKDTITSAAVECIKHHNNNCVVVVDIEKYVIHATIIPVNSNRAVLNSTLQHFSQWI